MKRFFVLNLRGKLWFDSCNIITVSNFSLWSIIGTDISLYLILYTVARILPTNLCTLVNKTLNGIISFLVLTHVFRCFWSLVEFFIPITIDIRGTSIFTIKRTDKLIIAFINSEVFVSAYILIETWKVWTLLISREWT